MAQFIHLHIAFNFKDWVDANAWRRNAFGDVACNWFFYTLFCVSVCVRCIDIAAGMSLETGKFHKRIESNWTPYVCVCSEIMKNHSNNLLHFLVNRTLFVDIHGKRNWIAFEIQFRCVVFHSVFKSRKHFSGDATQIVWPNMGKRWFCVHKHVPVGEFIRNATSIYKSIEKWQTTK